MSRDAINDTTDRVVGVPCTTHRPGRRLFASPVVLHEPDGGLNADSLAVCGQVGVLAKARLHRFRGALSPRAMAAIDGALLIALDLPGQV